MYYLEWGVYMKQNKTPKRGIRTLALEDNEEKQNQSV
jgi:hypothetical protein